MPNYQNSKIYTIRSLSHPELVYYGATTQSLSNRIREHKKRFKSNKNNMTSKHILKYGDAYIELVENCPCNSKEELTKIEGGYIRNNECVNKYIPDRTQEEYREANKEQINKKHKEYYEINKEQIKQKVKKYREKNKDEINKKRREERDNCPICNLGMRKDSIKRHLKLIHKII